MNIPANHHIRFMLLLLVVGLPTVYCLVIPGSLKRFVLERRHETPSRRDYRAYANLRSLSYHLIARDGTIPDRIPDELPFGISRYCPMTENEYSYFVVGNSSRRLVVVMDSLPHISGNVFIFYSQDDLAVQHYANVWGESWELLNEVIKSAKYNTKADADDKTSAN